MGLTNDEYLGCITALTKSLPHSWARY